MRTSKTTKNAYLAKLTENIQMKSVDVGKDLDGSTPPSVFIGRWSYPKVYAGPMMVPQLGDTYIMDSPEQWILLKSFRTFPLHQNPLTAKPLLDQGQVGQCSVKKAHLMVQAL